MKKESKTCDNCRKESKDLEFFLDKGFQEYFWLCGKCRKESERNFESGDQKLKNE